MFAGTRKTNDENIMSNFPDDGTSTGKKHSDVENRGPELQSFTLARVRVVTNNFSTANKLGEGGFGPVYKVRQIIVIVMEIIRLRKCSY